MNEENTASGEFLWGAATSSHQIEGHNRLNDWWHFESQGLVEGGVISGAATNHWELFREDLALAQGIGLNSYRFSVEWSRLEPEEGRFDDAAFEWYRELIAECERRGLIPMLTLHHFTSPFWLAQKGGFAWEGAPELFARFVGEVAKRLGSRVPIWCTLNEPMVLATGSYLLKTMPPATFAPELCSRACAGLLKSHVLAYDILHSRIEKREGPWRDRPIEVGIAHNMLDFMPGRAWHPIEALLASILDRFYNRAWLDAITGRKQHFGILGLVPYARQVTEARGRTTADFIGVNYYTKAKVRWRPPKRNQDAKVDVPLDVAFADDGDPASDMGWALHPGGLGRLLRFVSQYGKPIYITENGIADRDDRHRPGYLRAHLEQIARAVEAGVDIRGYYHWSLLDNFEWIKGFDPRFGLFRVNYSTFERTPTQTAEIYKEIVKVHRENRASKPRLEWILTKI